MNKKLKVLSSVICGLALSSGIALTSVQAAPAKINGNDGISIKAIIPSQKYSYYTTISDNTKVKVEKYVQKNGDSSTADGIRDILVNGGVNRITANNISFSLLDLAYKKGDPFPEMLYGGDMKVLSTDDGKYNVIDSYFPNQSYSIYLILNPQDVAALRESYYKEPRYSGFNEIDYFTNELLNKGIINDSTIARNVAKIIYMYGGDEWDCLAGTNENLLILQGADGTTFAPAREAK